MAWKRSLPLIRHWSAPTFFTQTRRPARRRRRAAFRAAALRAFRSSVGKATAGGARASTTQAASATSHDADHALPSAKPATKPTAHALQRYSARNRNEFAAPRRHASLASCGALSFFRVKQRPRRGGAFGPPRGAKKNLATSGGRAAMASWIRSSSSSAPPRRKGKASNSSCSSARRASCRNILRVVYPTDCGLAGELERLSSCG